ncbi:uncharacterized protein LOC124437394 [Xenia sp. Carnegie-2017]|uniref:uncharacterized protein LOC124437394 n=1 Tax=Xenia sp. Carnegie-2017 TaxID=2897299 RepID=UPI001F04D1F5|nr:uncharacterized protein LOC124437394 [Xenia sp. Carnegie-2017]
MLEVEIYKIVDAGHFWCKPSLRNTTEAEKYFTLNGKINDYCAKFEDVPGNQSSVIPKKGITCLVKRTSDRCWYRGKVLGVFHTMNGPQVRVLLVDVGERTFVPGIWVQEIPKEFLNVPHQTMECFLFEVKPLTMVTSYFDLTTQKRPGDLWDLSATEWMKNKIKNCLLQVDVKQVDNDGIHHVTLFATDSEQMFCINDELVNQDYAVVTKSIEDPKREKGRVLNHDDDEFAKDLRVMREKYHTSIERESISEASDVGECKQSERKNGTSRYQPLNWSEDSDGSAYEISPTKFKQYNRQSNRKHSRSGIYGQQGIALSSKSVSSPTSNDQYYRYSSQSPGSESCQEISPNKQIPFISYSNNQNLKTFPNTRRLNSQDKAYNAPNDLSLSNVSRDFRNVSTKASPNATSSFGRMENALNTSQFPGDHFYPSNQRSPSNQGETCSRPHPNLEETGFGRRSNYSETGVDQQSIREQSGFRQPSIFNNLDLDNNPFRDQQL